MLLCEWLWADSDDLFTHILGDSFTGTGSMVGVLLQNDLTKIYNARNHTYGDNFKLKRCTCAQSMALGTRTTF